MKSPCRLSWFLMLVVVHLSTRVVAATGEEVTLKIASSPRHEGRIDSKLFGNFVELLDDVVPGMWAELLNDRGFEGVVPAAKWVYYDGSATFCDRTWDKTDDWTIEKSDAANGPQSARISGHKDRWTGLTQSGLVVKTGET